MGWVENNTWAEFGFSLFNDCSICRDNGPGADSRHGFGTMWLWRVWHKLWRVWHKLWRFTAEHRLQQLFPPKLFFRRIRKLSSLRIRVTPCQHLSHSRSLPLPSHGSLSPRQPPARAARTLRLPPRSSPPTASLRINCKNPHYCSRVCRTVRTSHLLADAAAFVSRSHKLLKAILSSTTRRGLDSDYPAPQHALL